MEEVPHVIEGYPPPAPPDSRRDKIFRPKDFTDVDNRAKQAPDNLVNNFDDLLTYLLKDATSDLAKVRSLFVWLSARPVITVTFPKAVRPNTPLAWLKRIKFDRTLYADLFAVLCRKAEVPCVIIGGSSKGAGYEVGQKEPLKLTNRWNAVHVQGSWRLINVPWALITTDGIAEGDWDLVERDGQAVREKEVSNKEVLEDLNEFWFLTDPEVFNAFCHAKEPRWQLLENPWTDAEFLEAPRYAEDMFTSDWDLISDGAGDVKAEGGKCQIVFAHPPGAKSVSLMYNLYFNAKLSPKPLPEELQLDRYIVESSKEGQKALLVRLPQDGVYRVEVAGVMDEDITVLGEFRITSVNVKKQPPPFPDGCTQIGYNEVAADAGLIDPSEEDGIVEAQPGERKNFSFKRRVDGRDPLGEITARLTHNERTSEDLSKYVDITTTKDDVNVSVQVPPASDNNEYGLCIGILPAASRSRDNQSDDTDYTRLLNYIITQDGQMTFAENKQTIQCKNDLLAAIKNVDVVQFYKSLKAAGDFDPLTKNKVTSFLTEVNKIKFGRLKTLVEATNGSNLNELEQALAAYEEVEQANSSSIKQAKACIDLLRELKDDGDMQFLEKALRHAYDVKTKHNTIIQRAEDTLVAYYEKVVTEAYYKRNLEALKDVLDRVAQSCVADRVMGEFMYKKAKGLQKHLEEAKRVTDKIGHLSTNDLRKIAGSRGKDPHPHVQSVLMATFILLGEREQELWNWKTVQNLLERRGEVGVIRAMKNLDIDKLTDKQVNLAESHVRTCQVEVVKAEDFNTALFLQWVNNTVGEKRDRDAVRHHHTQISNKA